MNRPLLAVPPTYRSGSASHRLPAAALLCSGLGLPLAVFAQEPSADAAAIVGAATTQSSAAAPQDAQESGSARIEEIVVTAQKREQGLQEVPISIQAFGGDQLDARGVSDPTSLPQITPGLVFNYAGAFTVIFLRGIGADGFVLADPSIAMYVDGIYFPFSGGAAQSFGSVQRIEVLKGPQGTLFGRNAVGGAISVTTQAPSFTDTSTSVTSAYSRFDDFDTRANLNVPLADNLAVNASLQFEDKDNFRTGTLAGNPLPQEITRGARVKVRYAPSDSVDLTLAALRSVQTGVASSFGTNGNPSPLGSALLIQPQPDGNGANDAPAHFEMYNTVVYGQAAVQTGWFDVKLLGSNQNTSVDSLYDFDGSPMPIATFAASPFAKIQTGELQLISNDSSWDADHLQWIAGYYYFHGKQGLDPARFSVAGSVLDGVSQLGASIPAGSFLDQLGLVLPNTTDGILDASGRLGTDSNSVYTQGTYHFIDQVALTLGGRYQDEKRTVLKSVGGVVTPTGEIQYLSAPHLSNATKTFSPKVSLDFQLTPAELLYLSWQKATKSSTYNVINFLPFLRPLEGGTLQPQLVKPEHITAYEIGWKSTLFDGTTRFDAAAFWYELRDTQVQFVSLLAGGVVTFENAPKSRVRGVDVDIASKLLPSLLGDVELDLGGTFLDTRYTEFPCGQGYNIQTGIYDSCMDLTGSRVGRAPKFSGTASLSKTVPVGSGQLELATDYYYNSGYYYLAQENPNYEEKAYGVLGARASYLYSPWNLRITAFGRNLLNKYYRVGIIPTDFGAIDNPAPPRVYGLRLNWDY